MAQHQPKTVLLPVKLQSSNPFRKVFGVPSSPGGPAAAAGEDWALAKKSEKLVALALDKLVVPHDTLIVLLIQPPPYTESAEQLKQYEVEMQACLQGQLATSIDVASAQNIRVEVAVRLRSDRGRAILCYADSLKAAIVVMARPESKLNFLKRPGGSQGSSTADVEIEPDALAKELPSTCKVMVAQHGKIVESLTGEVAQGPEPMQISGSVGGKPLFNAAMPAPARGPSAATLPTEVLRDLYGENEFSLEDLARATKGFSQGSEIGMGGSGSVYFGELGNRLVAIKRLRWWPETAHVAAAMSSDSNMRQFSTELRVMRRIRHPNLLELLGVCFTNSEMLLVFDFLPNGSLDQRLRKQPVLTWKQRLEIAAGAACGLQYLHTCRPPIIHRDVKSANILLDQNLTAKVADFGLAKIAPDRNMSQSFMVSAIMGTQGYLAPEYGHTCRITKAIDVFAFGVVLLELVTGHVPYHPERIPPFLSDYAIKVALEGNYSKLLDPRLRATGSYDDKQLEHVLMVAVLCLSPRADERPKMEEVAKWLVDLLQKQT